MYASIPDALRALARKIGADANGRNEEEILNNIVVKLGGTPVTNHGVAGSIGAMTKVVDLDVMHNMTTLSVTPTTSAQLITPESPVDGYSSVSVSAVTSAIDQNIVAGNIKKDVEILGVTGSYEGSGAETFEVTGSFDSSVSETVTVNKTISESLQAYATGKNVVFKITDTSESRLYTTFVAMPILNSAGTENDSMFGAYAVYPDPQLHKLAILGFYYTGASTLGYIVFGEK